MKKVFFLFKPILHQYVLLSQAAEQLGIHLKKQLCCNTYKDALVRVKSSAMSRIQTLDPLIMRHVLDRCA